MGKMRQAEETVEGSAVEVGSEVELRAVPSRPVTLFGTNDPVEVIVRASAVAAALKDVLVAQKMVTRIQGKEYVQVSGWTTLGSMLGVVPVVTWTRPVDGGWEARAEARMYDGRTVGAAESMCTESEGGNWGPKATSNARRSMAQTRAVSKALRGPLGFVVTLAGYQGTPAEEMRDSEPDEVKVKPSFVDFARAAIRAKDPKRHNKDDVWVALKESQDPKVFWGLMLEELTDVGADSEAVYSQWKAMA